MLNPQQVDFRGCKFYMAELTGEPIITVKERAAKFLAVFTAVLVLIITVVSALS